MSNPSKKGRGIGKGNTAEVYEWGEDKVLKLFFPGYSDAACAREFAVTGYVSERLGIAPMAYEIVHEGDRTGAVYERIFGDTMGTLLLRHPRKIAFFARKMAACHALIHARAPVALEALRVKDKLAKAIESAPALSDGEKRAVLSYLNTLPKGDSICHFDFHPDNIMIAGERYYIIDWVDGCVGDPLADVARTVVLTKYGLIKGVKAPLRHILAIARQAILAIYLREYIRLTGASRGGIHKWILPIAAARLDETIPQAESDILLKLVRDELAQR